MSEEWTINNYVAHNEALRKAEEKFQAERDRRYTEIDKANTAAVVVAEARATKADEKIEQALKEYKESNNEWRKTVSDLIAMYQGGSKGMRDMGGWITAAIVTVITLWDKFQ